MHVVGLGSERGGEVRAAAGTAGMSVVQGEQQRPMHMFLLPVYFVIWFAVTSHVQQQRKCIMDSSKKIIWLSTSSPSFKKVLYYIVAALVSVNYCTTSMLNNRGMCVVQGVL